MKAAMEVEYTHDFLTRYNGSKTERTDLEVSLIRLSSKRDDKSSMLQNYPEVKSQLKAWSDKSNGKRYSWATQSIALRYLRNLFIDINSQESIKESLFLFELLIANKAIDLDVLTDTYLKIRPQLSEEKSERYFDYLHRLYLQDKQEIRNNAMQLKKAYEKEKNKGKKIGILRQGKTLEQKSMACLHAKEALGFSD